MSADGETSAVEAPVDNGPQIITVIGQDAPAPEVKADEPKKAEAEATGSEEPLKEGNRDEKGRFKPAVQDRIDELTRARREAEREAEYWKIRANGDKPGATKVDPNAVPVRSAFTDDEKFLDALADHKVNQKLAERDQQSKQQQESTAKVDTWNQKLAAARSEITDFDTVVNTNETPVAAHVAELIMENDQGAKMLHHFAMNPDELAKLNDMTPAKAAFFIGKLESKFESAPEVSGSSKPVVEKVSKAPPPASRNVGAGRATETPLADLPMEDYIARRKQQGASWAR